MSVLSKHVATVATVIMFGVPCTPVAADPIRINISVTSGTISAGPTAAYGAWYNIAGSGFSFQGVSRAMLDAHRCNPCLIGQSISLSGFLSPSFFGTLNSQGRTFVLFPGNTSGGFSLDAPSFVLPPSGSGRIPFTTPFSLGGSVMLEGSGAALQEFDFALTGSGRATGTFSVSALPQGTFISANNFRFDFGPGSEPIPEPASVVLLATGLAGLIIRSAHRRSCAAR
jgi:PEP-CTERM motif